MKILFAGGGTLGSVSPLIAIAQKIQERNTHSQMLWVGTKAGPEVKLVQSYRIPFVSIPTGKLRRYFSFKNAADIMHITRGFLKSIYILFSFKPHLIIGAGSFVQVPLVYAAAIFWKKARIIIHQQDVCRGLANKLCTRCAHLITVSVKESLRDFPLGKAAHTGNPIREETFTGNMRQGFALFKMPPSLPVVLILGGGTGSQFINTLVRNSLSELTRFCFVLHLTGKDKEPDMPYLAQEERYSSYELLTDALGDAYAIADIVVSRAGFSTITELAALAKPTILIPIPETHQEKNADYFKQRNAVLVLRQSKLTDATFVKTIKKLMDDSELRFKLSSRISTTLPIDATEQFLAKMNTLFDQSINVRKW